MMKSEFESREAFECIFGDEGEIDLSKDETGEYSFQPSRFAYSFFLVAWQYRQTEVDELQCEVKRINLWYSNVKLQLENKEIDSAIDAKKIDELQRRNQMLNDNIKEQGQKLVYQNEVIETQAEKLLGLRDEKAELQKRVDAALKLIESWNRTEFDKTTHWTEGYEEGCYSCAAQLEQALKGGSNHE